jgi:hypothetical protein
MRPEQLIKAAFVQLAGDASYNSKLKAGAA